MNDFYLQELAVLRTWIDKTISQMVHWYMWELSNTLWQYKEEEKQLIEFIKFKNKEYNDGK